MSNKPYDTATFGCDFAELRDEGREPEDSRVIRLSRLPEFVAYHEGHLEELTDYLFLVPILGGVVEAALGVKIAYRYACPRSEAAEICDRFLNTYITPLALNGTMGIPLRRVGDGVVEIHIDFFPSSAIPELDRLPFDDGLEQVQEHGWDLPSEQLKKTN